jgi:putative transposase
LKICWPHGAGSRNWRIGANHEHRHSAINFVTPAQCHAGLDQALLDARAEVYEKARQANPQRWSRQARQWMHVEVVHLNPDTLQIKEPQHPQKAA